MDLIPNSPANGMTVVMVTHERALASGRGRLVFLADGKLIENRRFRAGCSNHRR